jgi:hypothetical protein
MCKRTMGVPVAQKEAEAAKKNPMTGRYTRAGRNVAFIARPAPSNRLLVVVQYNQMKQTHQL